MSGLGTGTGFAREAVALGLGEHCRRVAALACELARRLGLPSAEIEAVQKTALAHHSPSAGTRGTADRTPAAEQLQKRARIVEVANLFDERLEWLPYEPAEAGRIVQDLVRLSGEGFLDAGAAAALARWPGPGVISSAIESRLPAYPAVAMRLLHLVREDRATVDSLGTLVASDPALATAIVGTANSALYRSVRPITTIARAIAHIGLGAALKVALASSLKPLFASRGAGELWEHSIEVARACHRIARRFEVADPDEALVAGLVHDAGRLVIQNLPGGLPAAHYAMSHDSGCPIFADVVVLGTDHARIGADALTRWALPPELVDAVRYHHQPERGGSPLSMLLYLAEYVSGSDEDIPSARRLHQAVNGLKIPSATALLAPDTDDDRALKDLLLAA